MTELFDPPINKYDLPKHDVSSTHCFMIAALAMAATVMGVSVAEGAVNMPSVSSIFSVESNSQKQPEGFCENFRRRPTQYDNSFHKLVDRTFCNGDLTPNPTP